MDSVIPPLGPATLPPAMQAAGNASGDASFDQLLSSLVASPMNALGGEGGLNGVMSIFMFGLLEQLVDRLPEGMAAAGAALGAAVFQHINQFDAERASGGDGRNADCGPTALVMALRAIGLNVAGGAPGTSDGDAIRLARAAMVTDRNRDGLDASGGIADAERNTFTNLGEVQRGAQLSGAVAQQLAPNAESIRQALLRGSSVVVLGTFSGKSPLPWTGDRGPDNAGAPGGATGHFVTVTGYDPRTGAFTVHDPARRTPLALSGPALEYFMRGNPGALAIARS